MYLYKLPYFIKML